jgi:TonB family protein
MTFVAAALAASLLLPAAIQADDPIIVESRNIAQQAWVARLASDLDAKLRYPRMTGSRTFPVGGVSISFQCGSDGRPESMVIARKSGSRILDRAALRAVEKLSGLHPLPTGFASNQPVRADIVFADSPENASKLANSLQQDNARRELARKPGVPRELALNVTVTLPV